jgi:hypothetical protein
MAAEAVAGTKVAGAFGPVGLGVMAATSLIGGLLGSSAARKKAKAAKAMAQYNAAVTRANAKAQSDALKFKGKRLAKQQREIKAQQRMSVAGRGGLETGTDLLSLIESAKNMQLDLLEIQRQSDIARISGENQALGQIYSGNMQAEQYKSQGRQALISGVIGAAGAYAQGKLTPTAGRVAKDSSFLNSISNPVNPNQMAGFGQPLNYNNFYNPLQKYGF